jgi:hypothetical protein
MKPSRCSSRTTASQPQSLRLGFPERPARAAPTLSSAGWGLYGQMAVECGRRMLADLGGRIGRGPAIGVAHVSGSTESFRMFFNDHPRGPIFYARLASSRRPHSNGSTLRFLPGQALIGEIQLGPTSQATELALPRNSSIRPTRQQKRRAVTVDEAS